MAVRGLFGSQDFEAGIRVRDVRDLLFNLQPNEDPFVTILIKLSKLRSKDDEFHWFEDDILGNYSQINNAANYLATDLVLILDSVSMFMEGDVAKVIDSDEVLLVTGVDDTAKTITVKRGWGTTAAAAINDNYYIYRLGSSMQEGYTAPESLVTAKTKKSNYIQDFSKTVMITERANAIATYGGNRRDYEINKKGKELKAAIEAQFIWGEPKQDLTGAQPRHQTGGIYYFLGATAPVLNMNSAALTESKWEGLLKDVFTYSQEDRICFTSSLVNSQISQFASAKQRMEPGTTIKYGVKVKTYHSANGDVHLVVDRHFSGPNVGKGLILDVKNLGYRYLEGLDFKLAQNIQPKNAHYIQDEYYCSIGLELHQALLHGHFYGVV